MDTTRLSLDNELCKLSTKLGTLYMYLGLGRRYEAGICTIVISTNKHFNDVEGCKRRKTRTLTSGGISNAICSEAPPMSSDPAVFTPRGVELPPEARGKQNMS